MRTPLAFFRGGKTPPPRTAEMPNRSAKQKAADRAAAIAGRKANVKRLRAARR